MQRYPLSWPDGWKRTAPGNRKRATFGKGERQYSSVPGGSSWTRKRDLSVYDATTRVLDELRRLGVQDGDAIISTNLQVRLDGLPRSNQAEPADPGVAVYWQKRNEPMRVMALDRYDRVADNLAAVAATLEAMRAIERHGGAQILERAFTGFDALPAPGQTTVRGWRDIFGFGSLEPTRADVEAVYKALRSRHHPDKGGDPEMFHGVQMAYEQACKELKL